MRCARNFKLLLTFPVALSLLQALTNAQSELGIFSKQSDVGQVKNAGRTTFDAEQQSYVLSGSGSNMWFGKDEFHFVWKKVTGDFVLHARGHLLGEGVDPHRKFGWMIRNNLDTDSPYVDIAVHGDGLTSMQFRRTSSADTEQIQSAVSAPDVIQLSRNGNRFVMSVAKHGDLLQPAEHLDLPLEDEVYVGLFVCSHNADVVEQAAFDNVRLIRPAASDFRPYRDYIGSHLEILDVSSGRRKIVHTVSDSLQAPNWTKTGQLIFNRNGALFAFDASNRQISSIDSGSATRNNNDHVLSFDGQWLGISHHSAEDNGRSNVYIIPATGGQPRRLTAAGPSYLHGWSPDGKYVIYTAERNGEFDIYRLPVSGGQEENLTRSEGLDDGSEYTPDGKQIYFNSTRSGRMQIWRMNANGSSPEQVTDDAFNNWFPHVSPDGKHLVMLSFDGDVSPTDHPFYKHVLIRQLNISNGESKVLAYVYGGQGTINVPSWSPDSQQLAFVSNSQVE
ncbi:MAG: TolB family protein [Planctomycetales bacterium]|nr:TolB family protein [Planctomycetales bacterium]